MLGDTTLEEYARFKDGEMSPDEEKEYLARVHGPSVPKIDMKIASIPITTKTRKLLTHKWRMAYEDEDKADHPPLHPEKYHSTLGVNYDDTQVISYTDIEVLSFLKGKKWDEIAVGYVHGLRPSQIRVTTGMCKLNAHVWRVTVIVDEENTIERITQEVEVALPSGVAHGEALSVALHYGIDSPQTKWYLIPGFVMMVADGIIPGGAYYKTTPSGEIIDFPVPEVEDELTEMIIDQLESEKE